MGSALLSALLVGFDKLALPDRPASLAFPSRQESILHDYLASLPASTLQKVMLDIDCKLLLDEAHRSAQKCFCEGSAFITKHEILKCKNCGQTICSQCKGSPTHSYQSDSTTSRRELVRPENFVNKWSPQFPLRVRFNNGSSPSPEQFQEFRKLFVKELSDVTADRWSGAFKQAFIFDKFCQQTSWTISYRSSTARIELVLSEIPEWRLCLDPPKELALDSPLQRRLRNHVARARIDPNGRLCIPDSDLQWEFVIPFQPITLDITGSDMVKSWRAEIGLENHSDELVPSKLNISFKSKLNNESRAATVEEVTGPYTLIPNCGTAFRSLYKKLNDIAP